MSTLGDFRSAVQAALEAAYGFEFLAGEYVGVSQEATTGCVWSRGKREWAEDVQIEELHLGVRVFPQWSQQEGELQSGPLEEEYEEFVDTLQATLKPLRTTLGPWMFRVVEVEVNRDSACVEALLVGLAENVHGG